VEQKEPHYFSDAECMCAKPFFISLVRQTALLHLIGLADSPPQSHWCIGQPSSISLVQPTAIHNLTGKSNSPPASYWCSRAPFSISLGHQAAQLHLIDTTRQPYMVSEGFGERKRMRKVKDRKRGVNLSKGMKNF